METCDSFTLKGSKCKKPPKAGEKSCHLHLKSTTRLTPVKTNVSPIKKNSPVKTSQLSGPVFAFVGKHKGIKYYLFGDIHFSLERTCLPPCKGIDENMKNIDPLGSENCWDITRLVADIIRKSGTTDVYLEVPYTKKEMHLIGDHGLPNFFRTFRECFFKRCKLKNARFHYVDIRLKADDSLQASNYFLGTITSQIIRDTKENPFEKSPSTVILEKAFANDSKLYLEIVDVYLNSTNFIVDLEKVLDKLTDNLDVNAFIEKDLIVKRGGKTMHKIGAQLKALKDDGQTELATKIKDYTKNYYLKGPFSKFRKPILEMFEAARHKVSMGEQDLANLGILFKKMRAIIAMQEGMFMDAYLLARMFRTFPNTKHTPSDKRIIYAGSEHIKTYVDFFEKELDVKFKSYGFDSFDPKSPNRCIDININEFLS